LGRIARELDDQIRQLARAGVARSRMTVILGCSTKTIQRRLEAMGLQSAPATPVKRDSVRNQPPPPAQEISPVMEAVICLGAKERNGAYWLDGRPVNAKTLVERFNAVRKSHGLEPVGRWV
jgi:hypothetical protein